MSKGLEALERLTTFCGIYTEEQAQMVCKDIDIIEKLLKSLEIIKSKQVDCYNIINSVDYKHYLVLMKEYDKSWLLTKQEYDLLKEVLLND